MEFYIVKSEKECVKFPYFKISSLCSLLYVFYIIFYNILNDFSMFI